MHPPSAHFPPDIYCRGRLFKPTILVFLTIALNAIAQPVVQSIPSAPPVPPALRKAGNSGSVAPLRTSSGANQKSPYHWGPLSVHPHFSERFIYSDGLQTRPGRTTNSYVNTLSPGFRVDLGSRWTFDYTAAWTLYTNRDFDETLDHSVHFAGTLSRGAWVAQFTQGYATTSAPMIETARQTGQEMVTTRLGLSHQFSPSLSGELGGAQNLRFVEGAPDSYDWSTDQRLHYHLSTRIDLAIGNSLGYTDMDPGANMAYVRPHAQVNWEASDKLQFNAHGGYEIRQIYARGVAAKSTPVFGGSLQYRPFQHTKVSLTVDRSVSPSVLRNQVNDSTSWNAGFSQRLLGHFNLSGNYGERDSGYIATVSRVTAGRKDKNYTYDVRLGTTFLRRGTIGLLYQGTHNSSNAEGFGFTSTQTGVEIGYRY